MNYLNFNGNTVAGVTLIHISDESPYPTANKGTAELVYLLERSYDKAQAAFNRVAFEPESRGAYDDRIYNLWLFSQTSEQSPYYSFLVTRRLLKSIRAACKAKGADLSQDELLVLCLQAGEDTVSADFRSDAMNAVNRSYYASDIAFDPLVRPATLYGENQPLNIALGRLLAHNLDNHGDQVRIKELASGSDINHWKDIAEGLASGGVKRAAVTLSDFTLPDPTPDNRLASRFLTVSTEAYSLLDELPMLPEEDRYDALITTYGFDSVWQPEDLSLTRISSQWYKSVYRVKIADWVPRKRQLLKALRHAQPLPAAHAYDYDGIVIETAMEPIDISQHAFARYIQEAKSSLVNLPGGLIKRVVNAYEAQLKKGGIFIIGDTANFGFEGYNPNPYGSLEPGASISGIAARYKVEDYVLAKQILEAEYGLSVELISFDELTAKHLPNDWHTTVPAEMRQQLTNKTHNGIMLVKGNLRARPLETSSLQG